jgi:ribonucleoside-diphosphate reductase alpha subunit
MNPPENLQKSYMSVIKRSGQCEQISFDKILRRIEVQCSELNLNRINAFEVSKETIGGLKEGITTEEIDHFAATNCSDKIRDDPQYDKLATALCVSRLHKMTDSDFMVVTEQLFNAGLVTEDYYKCVCANIKDIQSVIDYSKDYDFDYFGFKTLEKSYLQKIQNVVNGVNHFKIVERPQHMLMRVAVALNTKCVADLIETYKCLSERRFIFGSPTLYNAGSKYQQLSSCFLLKMEDDLESIFDTIKDAGLISKRAGGIGIGISNVRASGSRIEGTNGQSTGIIPMIQVLNRVGKYVNQGGKRNGAIATFLEPWHADVFAFCELRSNKGNEDEKARDIFLGLWIPDLFMKRVQEEGMWSLMCPNECPGLTTSYGEEFEKLYTSYEEKKMYRRRVQAKDLWFHILTQQIETGVPYMMYKDSINKKSNQKNLGVIQSSNLCSEICQFTSNEEISVCTLSSICLPRFVEKKDGQIIFNYEKLQYIAGVVTKNLNNVIDINFYPIEKAKNSNSKNRPIGIGIQGLADVYYMMEVPYDSDEARTINRKIFESIYFGSLTMSNQLAIRDGPYETFHHNGGSPFSHGLLQWHLWGLKESDLLMGFDWNSLIQSIIKYGTRNSLLTTIMPTASTSQIMGNCESYELPTSNVALRTTQVGEFTVINKHLVEKLIELGIWNKDVQNELLYDKGSIQHISVIPDNIKQLYKTAFELQNKPIIIQSAERGPFIDQSQSFNMFCQIPDFTKLTSALFYGWKLGTKCALYYLKTQPAADPQSGLDIDIIKEIEAKRGIIRKEKVGRPKKAVKKEVEIAKQKSLINCDSCSG